jgi:hypothetical protein
VNGDYSRGTDTVFRKQARPRTSRSYNDLQRFDPCKPPVFVYRPEKPLNSAC